MAESWLRLALFAVVALCLATAAPAEERLDAIQAQLAALESELKEKVGTTSATAAAESLGRQPRMPVIDFKKRMPVIDFRKRDSWQPLKRASWQPLKRAAWQPLKRAAWQPLKRSSQSQPDQPRFQVRLSDEEGLTEALLETVEEHLRRDLEVAQAYGLKPQEILAFLHNKAQLSDDSQPLPEPKS